MFLPFWALLTACVPTYIGPASPIAKDGVLDLRQWDFEDRDSLKLQGDCLFYWNRLLTPETASAVPRSEAVTQEMARNWSAQHFPFPRQGYGTYRLTVLLPRVDMDIGFLLSNQDTSYRLWIDGKPAGANGVPAATPASAVPEYRTSMAFLHPRSTEVELLMQVSNFHVRHGGWGNGIYIGTPARIVGTQRYFWFTALAAAACLSTLFLYHVVNWLFRTKELPYLYFSMAILSILLNQGFSGEYLFFQLFPFVPWDIGWKLQFVGISSFLLFFCLYVRKLFPDEVPRPFLLGVLAVSLLTVAGCLVLPSYHVSLRLTVPLQIVSVAIGVALAAMIFGAAFRGRRNAWLFTAGILTLAALGTWDSLSTNFVVASRKMGSTMQFGFVGFLFLHSIVLSRRFSAAYARLDRLTEKLEEEVQERTLQLKEADRSKTDFFLHLSHEIRTPLTLLVNSMDEYFEKSSGPVEPALVNIRAYLDVLLREVLDFFDAARLEKGLRVFTHDAFLDLSAFVSGKADLYRSVTRARGMELSMRIEEGIHLKADPTAVDRLLNNLLDNAVKYNSAKGRIEVVLSADAGRILLEVADTGTGIDPENKDLIFLPYYRIGGGAGRIHGMGLGLAIVRSIVESLSGTIEVTPNRPSGARFLVSLPRPPAAEAEPLTDWKPYLSPVWDARPPVHAKRKPAPADAPLVLVVEDNEEMRRLLCGGLAERYRVREAREGAEALEFLSGGARPDLIVSDVVMDGIDGFGLLQKVMANDAWKDIPFLFLSAMTLDEKRREAYGKGVLDWIQKPFHVGELLSKIDSLIRHQALLREGEERRRFAGLGILLSSVAHEIFNPLSGISGPLAVLEKRTRALEGENAAEWRRHVEHIGRNASRIEKIVRTIRDIHADASLAMEPVHLRDAVEGVRETAGPGTGVAWHNEIPAAVEIRANPFALEQLLKNLTANALDAMPAGGTLRFSIDPSPDGMILTVRDTGTGMSLQASSGAFQPFFTTKGPGHMGMGLYLVRLLAARMGWDCSLSSQAGFGTAVALKLGRSEGSGP